MTVLFVALTIVLLLGVDWLVQRRARPAAAPALSLAHSDTVRLPRGVFFARSHTWMNLFPSGRAWLGVDDFVTRLLEKPTLRFLVRGGEDVKQGDALLVLAEGDRELTVRSPVDARIVAVNHELERHPDALRRAPFSEGWAFDLQPRRAADLKSMLVGEETRGWMRDEFARLRDVFAGVGGELEPAMLQDGGPPIAGAMKHVDPGVWSRFQAEFLEVK